MRTEESGQGKGMLGDINVLQLSDIEQDFSQLANRVGVFVGFSAR
jgi:hypothetical protein